MGNWQRREHEWHKRRCKNSLLTSTVSSSLTSTPFRACHSYGAFVMEQNCSDRGASSISGKSRITEWTCERKSQAGLARKQKLKRCTSLHPFRLRTEVLRTQSCFQNVP